MKTDKFDMNEEQRKAAIHAGGPLLLLAGPGTGKTRTLVGRYEHLLKTGVKPSEILCCSFSRKSADELIERISDITDLQSLKVSIGTFHSLALRILRSLGNEVGLPKDFEIWSNDFERRAVIKEIKEREKFIKLYANLPSEETTEAEILSFIDRAREELIDPEDASVRAAERNHKVELANSEIFALYEQYLVDNNKLDFPRMVQLAVKALQNNSSNNGSYTKRFKHLLVDEFQDINRSQKSLIDLFVSGGAKLWVVGDDFQAIYGFRGSNVRFMRNFEDDYENAEVHALKVNYRAGTHLVQLAENLSGHFIEGFKKKLEPSKTDTGQIFYDELNNENDEANAILEEISIRLESGIQRSDIAVLSRTKKRPVLIASKLIEKGIPVDLKDGIFPFEGFYEKQLIQAASIASGVFLKLNWPRVPKELFGFAKKLEPEDWPRKIKALTTFISSRLKEKDSGPIASNLEKLRDSLMSFPNAKSFFNVLTASFENKVSQDKVFIGTIHSAKGLEWDSVFLIGMEDGHLPQRQSVSVKIYDEERRMAYVGITRAKNFLFLSSINRQGKEKVAQSPFLSEMFGPQQNQEVDPVDIKIEQNPQIGSNKKSIQTKKISEEENSAFIKDRWKAYQERVIQKNKENLAISSSPIADGQGETSSSWDPLTVGTGFLQDAGYTTRKDGPNSRDRQDLLAQIFSGQQKLPSWLTDSVTAQWGAPNSVERFNKIRNTINVAIGTQKGRANPSMQAIKKWEEDMEFMDVSLKPKIAVE